MPCEARLSTKFYDGTCPNALKTIRSSVRATVSSNRRMVALIIRLLFHDCFVQGFDASLFLDGTASEKNATGNNGMIGFEAIDAAKAAVECVCPGVVSCADVLAVAARDASVAVGGPSWTVRLGRRDSPGPAIANLTNTNLPRGNNNLSQLIASFDRQGLTVREMVALSDGECYDHTMEAYLKMGKYEKVVSLFKEFESSNVEWTPFCAQIYRLLCESLAKSGKPFEALHFFREIIKKGLLEDPSLYSTLINSFASIREVKMVEDLLEEAEGKKMLRDPAVFLKVVLMYIELGLLEKTLDVVSSMKRANTRVSDCIFCAIVNGFSKKRGLSSAVKVYERLVTQGCAPGQVTYASVLNVYCRLGLYDKAEEVFWEMDNMGFDKCVVAYSSMIAVRK